MIKQRLDWNQADDLIKDIASHYKYDKITRIIGISRGGLIPAVRLSHLLNIPMETLNWQTRDGEKKQYFKLLNIAKYEDISTTLFVDDICDSGATLEEISKFVPDAVFATLVTKNQLPEFSPKMIGDEWIIFPWEVNK